MRKSTKIFIATVIVVVISAQLTSIWLLKSLDKELVEYTKDKQFIERSVDLYALACSSPEGATDKECIELTNKVHTAYERLNNDYILVDFYMNYMLQN